jgi:hypothetical protein
MDAMTTDAPAPQPTGVGQTSSIFARLDMMIRQADVLYKEIEALRPGENVPVPLIGARNALENMKVALTIALDPDDLYDCEREPRRYERTEGA